MKSILESARANLAALEGDTPRLEQLLQQHQTSTNNAHQAARNDHDKLTEAVEAEGRLNTVKSMLEQHMAEITETRQRLRGLQASAERTSKLERIRDATRTFRVAQARQCKIFDLAEQAVRRAIVAGERLAEIGNTAHGEAFRLAKEISPNGEARILREAVADTDLEPFPYWGEAISPWPGATTHAALSTTQTGFVRFDCVLDPADIALELDDTKAVTA